MTLSLNFYCMITLTILGIYQLPFTEVGGVKKYPKFFSSFNGVSTKGQDGSDKNFNYTYPSTCIGHTDEYCDGVVNCDTSSWGAYPVKMVYDNMTTFTFSLRYVDDNGNQNRRKATISPSYPEQVTEPIFASFVANFHCPDVYETEYFRKVYTTVYNENGDLFNDYSTYINFTIFSTKTACGNCDKSTFNLHDYVQLENQFDDFDPIPEEPVQTESENSE